jgi:hypothetical protein
MTDPDIARLIELLPIGSPRPWIRKWQSTEVHCLTGDGALRSQEDIDLAVAAVNAAPILLAALAVDRALPLDVERLANATARVVGWTGALDYHREWAAKVAREYAATYDDRSWLDEAMAAASDLHAARPRETALEKALERAEFALSLVTGATYDDRTWLDEAVAAQADAHVALARED